MSKQSEAVKKWRHNCKERIIIAMGGSCCVCGYNKCQASLALHHLDPSQKDFNFSDVRASPKSWTLIVLELRKCILVCHNCHNEIHSNVTNIPETYPSFNEDYADYKILNEKEMLDACLFCNKLKPRHLKFCSLKCSSSSQCKVDWSKIDLESELKSKSVDLIADEIGCSAASVYKRKKKLRIF